jgi:IS5 family transposase
LRLLALKHMFNWSYDELHRDVRANLVYREFTRIGGGKVPDDKTMGRLARQLGPEPVEKLHRRLVAIARERKMVEGRKLRVDTTVVETNIHYPTDSSLMGDGVRVLTRLMKRVTEVAGAAGTKLRNQMRSVKLRVVEIARTSRSKSEQGRERMKDLYEKLLVATAAVVGQAQRFVQEIQQGVKRPSDVMKQAALEGMKRRSRRCRHE